MQKHWKVGTGCLIACLACCSIARADVSVSNDNCKEIKATENGYLAIRANANYAIFVSGEAGSGKGTPDYSDAFENGFGAGIEADLRPTSSRLSYHLGASFTTFEDDIHKGIRFDELTYTDLYAGIKWHLWESSSKVDPYLRCDIGVSFTDKVEVTYKGLDVNYWDETAGWMVGAGLGANYMLTERLGGFIELKFQYRQAPDEEFKAAKADSNLAMPITLGIEYRF